MIRPVRTSPFLRKTACLPGARRCAAAPQPAAPVVPPPAPVAEVKLDKKKAATKAAPVSTKATRQDMQQLLKLLDGLAVSERPTRKDMFVALLQNHLGETSGQSLRVAHALAQLQALKRVTVKKDVVSYPSPERAPAPAKKAADPAVSKVAAPKPTAAKVALAFAILLLPYSLIGPFVGVFLDRWRRRSVLVYANLVRSGARTIDSIPKNLRDEVQKRLDPWSSDDAA